MKSTITLKICLSILFLFSSIIIFGQKRYSLSLQIKQGITGFGNDRNQTGSSFQEKLSVKLGNDISLGTGIDYFFGVKRRFSISGSVLWNFYTFQRKEESIFVPLGVPISIIENKTETFQCQSLLFPLKLNLQRKYFGFSLGVVPRHRLKTKVTIDYQSLSGGTSLKELIYTRTQFFEGERLPDVPEYGSIEFDSQMDIQYLLGINFYLYNQLTFSLEFRNLILKNNLLINGIDFINPNTGTISLSMNWRIF